MLLHKYPIFPAVIHLWDGSKSNPLSPLQIISRMQQKSLRGAASMWWLAGRAATIKGSKAAIHTDNRCLFIITMRGLAHTHTLSEPHNQRRRASLSRFGKCMCVASRVWWILKMFKNAAADYIWSPKSYIHEHNQILNTPGNPNRKYSRMFISNATLWIKWLNFN